jgi:predicted TIM-barrel fold metal-dependent hydrolase
MLIDVHMHAGDFTDPFDAALDADGLAGIFTAHQLDAGMVFCRRNALTLEIIEKIPQAYGFYWADPTDPRHLGEAREWLTSPQIKGVKFHPLMDGYYPGSPTLDPIMELIGETGRAALFHTGHAPFSEPLQVGELIMRHPDVPVILGHAGHGNVFYVNAAITLAARYPLVFLEPSGMPMGHKIAIMERTAPGRTLFGSDVPCHNWLDERDRVLRSGLDDDELDCVMGRNAERLFFPEGLPR